MSHRHTCNNILSHVKRFSEYHKTKPTDNQFYFKAQKWPLYALILLGFSSLEHCTRIF